MKLILKETAEDSYHDIDIGRIVKVLEAKGYEISRTTAQIAWERHSESYCAGWLFLPKSDEELVSTIMKELKEV